MRAVVQRVSEAEVTIDGVAVGTIGRGLVVLVGVEVGDTAADAGWLAGKIVRLRIFLDAAGLFGRSVIDVGGEVLVVSQFTLHASTARGNRPSFLAAARPEEAIPLYDTLAVQLGRPVKCGRFGAAMAVRLVNDGPVTIPLDSRRRD
jgi:D-tyrosyl-tRNA(Tyr) deacylase